MRIDLSCPIEVRGYALTRTERGVIAEVRLYNLTDRRIASFEAIARWKVSAENRRIVRPFSEEHVHACGQSQFRIALDNSHMPDADSIEILFNTVRFEDGDAEWHAGSGPYAEAAPLPPMGAEELSLLREAIGEDAVCWPAQNSETWTCVCGRMNPLSAETCARCRRSKLAALDCTPENARRIRDLQAVKPAREPITVLERRFERRRARLFHRTLLLALVALAVTAFLVMQDRPTSDRAALNASAAVETIFIQN